MIKLSIILPTYNRAWCIKRAINSVLRQNFQNWELIIIDDGSTDSTEQIIKKYLDDKRIKYFYKTNKGVGTARNYGIFKSSGQYITFLDSDDEFCTPEALSIINKDFSLHFKDVDIILYPTIYSDKNYFFTENNHNNEKFIITQKLYLSNSTKISGEKLAACKKDIFKHDHFPEYVNGFEGIFWTKMLIKHSFLYHNIPLRKYYIHNQSLSNNHKIPTLKTSKRFVKAYKEYIDINKKYWKQYNLQKEYGKNLLFLSYYNLLSNNKLECFNNLKLSIINKYYNILSFIIFTSIFIGRKQIKIIYIIRNKINEYRR